METRVGLVASEDAGGARDVPEHEIADTAFWVNVSRAKRVDLSRDVYAHLFVTPASVALWDEMARTVYPDSDVSVSLRNRFYLERMERFAEKTTDPAVINIAAGFTFYPYLLPASCRCLEVDYPGVVSFKGRRAQAWMRQGVLPERRVSYFGADLADAGDLARLLERVREWLGGAKAFVVMEGITYYLPRQSLDALFALLAEVLPPGSEAAFEHWPGDAASYPVFARFKEHLNQSFGWKSRGFTLFDEDYVRALPGFELVEALDSPEVERLYSDSRVLQSRERRLPALFKRLRRRDG